jgi:RimJ/RimL family protein N-acetyltransferase
LKIGGALIGSVGLVPLLDTYGQLPGLGDRQAGGFATPEVGLFWAIDPAYQRQGYALEAARALVEFAFRQLNLGRLLATTEYENAASQAVMRKLGMRLLRNPYPQPEHLQVVGLLENSLF